MQLYNFFLLFFYCIFYGNAHFTSIETVWFDFVHIYVYTVKIFFLYLEFDKLHSFMFSITSLSVFLLYLCSRGSSYIWLYRDCLHNAYYMLKVFMIYLPSTLARTIMSYTLPKKQTNKKKPLFPILLKAILVLLIALSEESCVPIWILFLQIGVPLLEWCKSRAKIK